MADGHCLNLVTACHGTASGFGWRNSFEESGKYPLSLGLRMMSAPRRRGAFEQFGEEVKQRRPLVLAQGCE